MRIDVTQPSAWPLFDCSNRHAVRRAALPFLLAWPLALSGLVLLAMQSELARTTPGSGPLLWTAITVTVALGICGFLALQVPVALRWLTAEGELPLAMLTGMSSDAMWRARVASAALPALLVPVLHLPLMLWAVSLGGVKFPHVAATLLFWVEMAVMATGSASVAGAVWAGRSRDRLQGAALTLMVAVVYLIANLVSWYVIGQISPTTAGISVMSLRPAWGWSPLELGLAAMHAVAGMGLCWMSQVLIRGRWRAALSGEAIESQPVEAAAPVALRSTPVLPITRRWSRRRPRCQGDPWFWKDFHVSGGGWQGWWVRAVGFGAGTILVVIWSESEREFRDPALVMFVTLAGWFVLLMYETSQILNVEFNDRMWMLARITPRTVASVIGAKCRAAAFRFLPMQGPVLAVFAITLWSGHFSEAIVAAGVMIFFAPPLVALVLYGSAIPQSLLAGGWRVVRTATGLALAIGFFCIAVCSGDSAVLLTLAVVLVPAVTYGLTWSTLEELNDPYRERLSDTGE